MPTFVQDTSGLVAIKNEVVDFVSSDNWKDTLIEYGLNLAFAILILIIGWWIAKWSGKAVRKILTKSKTDAGLISFLSSLVVIVIKIFVVVTAITQLGVQMTSFITILGAAGLAIGMAFSGTLANFAGGVMILLFKPFKVGDTILTQTQQGKVTEIQIFYTYLFTSDNKVVVMPNGPLANGSIVNFTREKKRRVDWIIALASGDDYVIAHQLLLQFLKEDQRVLTDPEPFIALGAMNVEAISITVRAWTATDDYWPVFYDLNQRVYQEFPAKGLHLATKVEEVKKTTK